MDDLRGQTVLVTGANGFIGRHLVERLVGEGVQVWTVVRQAREMGAARKVRQVVCPLERLGPDVWRQEGAPRFDVVFHLGGYTPKTGATANDLDRAFGDNIAGTRQLLASLTDTPRRVVFAGTLDVYAPCHDDNVISESSPLAPVSLYSSSKLFCEAYVSQWAVQAGSAAVVLRYGHIYGPGEEAYRKLIPETIRRLLEGISPVIYGTGNPTRDLLYVGDAVEATVRAVYSPVEHSGPINVVRGESATIRQITEMLVEISGFAGKIEYRTEMPDGRYFRFDNSKMVHELGSWPFVPLNTGLRIEFDSMRCAHE